MSKKERVGSRLRIKSSNPKSLTEDFKGISCF